MFIFISVLIIIAAIFLVLIVLVQNSKGGGLAANFQSSNQVMGVRKTADFLEKSTWTLASILIGLSILSSIIISTTRTEEEGSMIEQQVEEAVDPNALPAFPTNVPEEGEQNNNQE
jgi:preprotein translocase subunit SecG